MGMFSESVEVACGLEGQPVELQWGGRTYAVCAEPVHWYERRQWWAEEQRAHEIWRVQVVPKENPAVPEHLTLDLVRHTGSGRWRLLRIHDALRHKTA